MGSCRWIIDNSGRRCQQIAAIMIFGRQRGPSRGNIDNAATIDWPCLPQNSCPTRTAAEDVSTALAKFLVRLETQAASRRKIDGRVQERHPEKWLQRAWVLDKDYPACLWRKITYNPRRTGLSASSSHESYKFDSPLWLEAAELKRKRAELDREDIWRSGVVLLDPKSGFNAEEIIPPLVCKQYVLGE